MRFSLGLKGICEQFIVYLSELIIYYLSRLS